MISKRDISPTTESNYKKTIDRIKNKHQDFNIDNLTKIIYDYTNNWSSRKSYFSALKWYLNKELKEKIEECIEEENTIIQKNEWNDKQKKNYIEWDKIVETWKTLKDTDSIFYLILGLYIVNPPRRNGDFRSMKLNSKDENTFLYDKEKGTLKIRIPNHKTAKFYGTYEAEIKDQEYIEFFKKFVDGINDDVYLWNYQKASTFSTYIMRKFKQYYNVESYNINMLRHTYISKMDETSLKAKYILACAMGHKITTQAEYKKLNHTL